MNRGFGNLFSSLSNPSDPNATPSYDGWGPDFMGYWSLTDWMTWHQALVAADGPMQANQIFATAWNQQSLGAAPLNELEQNATARAYFHSTGLDQIISPTLGGALTDFTSAISRMTQGLPAAANTLGAIIPIALIGIALLYLLPPKSKIQSAKALFGK